MALLPLALAAMTPASAQQPAPRPPHWTKFCGKEPGEHKPTCMTTIETRLSGIPFVASVAVIEPEGNPKKLFRVLLPHGLRLASGARVNVDQGWPQFGQFSVCLANGCYADFDVRDDFVAEMRKGATLWLQAADLSGQPVSYSLQLENFSKAHEGPPVDPKAFAAGRRKDATRPDTTGSIRAPARR